MHRFYADERGIQGNLAWLALEDARHADRVLRLHPDDVCELFADGARYEAVICSISQDEAELRILSELPSTEASLRITLYQGLPKAEKLELIVQKAVELGAVSVVPVAMSRCIVKLDSKDGIKKQVRWQKIAREACKQSGRCGGMEVEAPISWNELLQRLPDHELSIVPWEDARNISLTQIHRDYPDIHDLAIVIGPEGGMSPQEVQAMESLGSLPVTLGPRILRTETAGLAAMAALFCLYGDMEGL